MGPTCCFYGKPTPLFLTQAEYETFYIALVYQVDLLMRKGILTFNTCMLPGTDLLCASYIAGLINNYNRMERKENAVPIECGFLRVHLYRAAFPDRLTIELAQMMGSILSAVSSIRHTHAASESDCVRDAIRSSTHMLAVCPAGDTPDAVSYAEECGLEVIRFTPEGLIAVISNPTK